MSPKDIHGRGCTPKEGEQKRRKDVDFMLLPLEKYRSGFPWKKKLSGNMLKWMAMGLFIVSFPFLIFCAPVDDQAKVKDGVQYGITEGLFRAKWWNFYERGLSFASGAFWQDAEADYRAALKQREADQRRARTYGMHFIDYFPHRELGVVLLEMGRIREAIDALESSLAAEESAKAKFYLNRARKALLLSGGVAADTVPPVIVIPDASVLTNALSFDVTADLSDDGYISSYSINGEPGFLELVQKRLKVEKQVPLLPGKNRIPIEVEDLLGNRSRRNLEIIADHLGPQISVINYMDGQRVNDSFVELTISFMDENGVARVVVNGDSINGGGVITGTHSTVIALQPGMNAIVMTAVDLAGNTTRGEIRLILASTSAGIEGDLSIHYAAEPSILTASAAMASGQGVLHSSDQVPHRESSKPESNVESPKQDGYPPSITFRGLLRNIKQGEPLTMTGRKKDNRFFIEGQISDAGGVSTVLINDVPIVTGAVGKELVFNRLVELTEGENRFIVTARDQSGNEETKEVVIQREIQVIDMNESRISLSIMPFKNESISPTLAESVYSLFVDRVINDERFNVVVRGEAFEAVLRELQLSQTDLVDNEKAVQAGRIVGSESIMFGKIIETPDAVEVFVHLTDTETSKIMASHDVYDQKKGRSDIEFLMQGLSSKFTYSVPLLEGKVLASKGEKFFLDLGKIKHAKLQEGLKCIAYRSEPFIVDGMVLGEDISVLGTLRLKNVQEKISIAALISDEGPVGTEIIKEDHVITK